MTSPRLLVVFILTLLPLAGACGGNSNMTTPPDTTLRTYDADDPNIQYTGRFDVTNAKQPKFALNATYVTAAFKGTGVSVLLKDEHRYGKWRNYYDAVVDGVVVAKIRPDDDISVIEYPVTSTLPYGDHVITLVKRTEPNVGAGFFVGFEFAGQIQPPPARPPHKMLFFGDSITAGSGVEVPDGDPGCTADDWGQPVENADEAYGPDAARMLDADYHVLGVSGIGLVRNYSSDPANDLRPMPMVYNLLFPELTNGGEWVPAMYAPDAIVVALGTNDFSPGDNPPLTAAGTPANARPIMDVATFVAAYTAFIDKLRADYAATHIFLMSSPMLVDGWPATADNLYHSKSDLESALGMLEDHYATIGGPKVQKVLVSKQGGGCGTHPNVQGQSNTAMELAAAVKSALGW
jgi:lysophospholipase L1-like esterase